MFQTLFCYPNQPRWTVLHVYIISSLVIENSWTRLWTTPRGISHIRIRYLYNFSIWVNSLSQIKNMCGSGYPTYPNFLPSTLNFFFSPFWWNCYSEKENGRHYKIKQSCFQKTQRTHFLQLFPFLFCNTKVVCLLRKKKFPTYLSFFFKL